MIDISTYELLSQIHLLQMAPARAAHFEVQPASLITEMVFCVNIKSFDSRWLFLTVGTAIGAGLIFLYLFGTLIGTAAFIAVLTIFYFKSKSQHTIKK